MSELPDLRRHVRAETPPGDATVVIRGGPDTAEKLRSHALRTQRAFSLDGSDVFGISVYCALDDIGPASAPIILGDKLGTYRAVHQLPAARLLRRGFTLLATFQRPHFTLILDSLDSVDELVDLLGPSAPNPRYRQGSRRRRNRQR